MTSARIILPAPLLAACLRIPIARAEACAAGMQEAMQVADISTPERLAHWLGQIGHETGRLRYLREIWGPTAAQARYEPTSTLSRRLGNTRPGDGSRYMGRGMIQVTGRANYAGLTERMKSLIGEDAPNFVATPRLLEAPRWAALSAADYWRSRGLNRWADSGDILTLTRRINGGTNGLADRQALYTHARAVLAQHLQG